jgi:hypothetical protein
VLSVEQLFCCDSSLTGTYITLQWFDGGVPVEMADDIAELIDSHAPDAVAFQGPTRHNAGFSGNVVRWSGTETGHTPDADMWSTIPGGAEAALALGVKAIRTPPCIFH